MARFIPFPTWPCGETTRCCGRVFDDRLDAAGWNAAVVAMADRYDRLSPSDKTTLHSSACTLGMLAYNLDNIGGVDVANTKDAYFCESGGGEYGGCRSMEGFLWG